jgi:hypothetical protein
MFGEGRGLRRPAGFGKPSIKWKVLTLFDGFSVGAAG